LDCCEGAVISVNLFYEGAFVFNMGVENIQFHFHFNHSLYCAVLSAKLGVYMLI